MSKLRGAFELLDVSFTYPNGTQALHHVNMKIPHGATVAFVGLSGAGKSTLLNLLTRFYAPTSGKILLDGKEISEYETGPAAPQNRSGAAEEPHLQGHD